MRRIFIFLILLIIVSIGLFFWWKNGVSAVNLQDKTERILIVRKGEGMRNIAKSLKKEGLIKDPVIFFLLVKKEGLDNKIQAGDFRLSPSMNALEIAEKLTHGTLDVWITIPEGKRSEEIADILKQSIPSYKNSWREALDKEEGYLFPDTYLIPKDANVEIVISIMKDNFENKFKQIENLNKAKLTKQEIVIIGSLVEREAKFSVDRPLVASVILNRLQIDMALQIDATIQYALGYQKDQKTWWKKNLTKEDLKIDSPFNTYLNTGLPPAPISNPGLEVLNAVVNTKDTPYLYYVSDKLGRNHYVKTLQEHQANIRKFGL